MKFIADTHIHSIASNHAYSTIMENIEAARQKGLVYMAMTEHGPKMPDAPHIWHCVNQWEVPSVYNGVNILHGAGQLGSLDLLELAHHGVILGIRNFRFVFVVILAAVLAGLEWVIASMHTPCIKSSTKENHTKAWLNIAKNPHVDVIGHCGDGRYDFDHETVIKAFKEYGKIVEIDNGSFGSRPHTESNCAEIARWCKRLEVPIVVDSDAHFAANIGVFDKAIKILTEIDFPERLIINTDVERFEQIVAQKRAGLNR